jgi:hypothetical protein
MIIQKKMNEKLFLKSKGTTPNVIDNDKGEKEIQNKVIVEKKKTINKDNKKNNINNSIGGSSSGSNVLD